MDYATTDPTFLREPEKSIDLSHTYTLENELLEHKVMEVDGRWFSFSIGWFLGEPSKNFQGCNGAGLFLYKTGWFGK